MNYGSLNTGKTKVRLSKQDLKCMGKLAKKELTPYANFKVNDNRIYELNIEKQRLQRYLVIWWSFWTRRSCRKKYCKEWEKQRFST